MVQNAITLAQKKDAELRITEGLHNHDSDHEINNIYPEHNDKQININGPHLITDCNESTCGRCKLNLENHTPLKCPRKHPFNNNKVPIPFIALITAIEVKSIATLNQTYNCLFLPTNQTTWLNCWKKDDKIF